MLEFSNYEVFLCLRYVFNLANNEDTDKIRHFASSLFAKMGYGLLVHKGLRT